MVEQWQVNDANDYTNRRTYNVEAISGNLQVTAYLKAASSYTVHYGIASDPIGGSLTAISDRQPFVSNSILYGGSDLIFTATPEAGYMLDHWAITSGGLATPEATKSVDANGRVYVEPIYSISPLNRHLTVRAYFRAELFHNVILPADSEQGTVRITYVTPVQPADTGEISPTTSASVRDAGTVKMTFQPLPGYDTSVAELQAIVVGAANADAHVVVTQAGDDYQAIVSNLTQELDLSSVEPYHALYAVTAAPADHGSVIPSTALARAGTEITLTVSPASGYRLSSLTLEPSSVILDQPVAAGTLLYTFAMPEESVTVTATFQLIPAPPPPPPPPPSGDGGGSVVEPPYVFSQGGSGTHGVRATAGLIPEIGTAKARGTTSFILDITGQLADAEETDVLTVTIPENIVKHLANLDLVMQTPYGDLGLPGQLVAALAAAGEGIAITLQAGDVGEVADELGAADELLSQPVDITATLREQATVMTVVTSAGTRQVTLRTVFTNRDGRTYLPTRDVAENLGFFVKWAAADDSITVTN